MVKAGRIRSHQVMGLLGKTLKTVATAVAVTERVLEITDAIGKRGPPAPSPPPSQSTQVSSKVNLPGPPCKTSDEYSGQPSRSPEMANGVRIAVLVFGALVALPLIFLSPILGIVSALGILILAFVWKSVPLGSAPAVALGMSPGAEAPSSGTEGSGREGAPPNHPRAREEAIVGHVTPHATPDSLLIALSQMDPFEFERELGRAFREHGYEATVTRASGDQGVDIILVLDRQRIAVQVKRYKGTVGNAAVQEVFAGKHFYDAEEAWVITTSAFSESARALAARTGVRLIEGLTLVRWMCDPLTTEKKALLSQLAEQRLPASASDRRRCICAPSISHESDPARPSAAGRGEAALGRGRGGGSLLPPKTTGQGPSTPPTSGTHPSAPRPRWGRSRGRPAAARRA